MPVKHKKIQRREQVFLQNDSLFWQKYLPATLKICLHSARSALC